MSGSLVSIVTPSFNQAAFLEETIQSVLTQSHPQIEYMVIDGGSTDGSPEIIRKYETRIAYWQSKKDNGFADAINQGWRRSKGEILAYLNSDDVLKKDAVGIAAQEFEKNPQIDVIYGDAEFIDTHGKQLGMRLSEEFQAAKVFRTWIDPIAQPSAFFRRWIYEEFGGLDERYRFCADFEYWVRIASKARFLYLPQTLSSARLHPESKTSMLEAIQAEEVLRLATESMSTPYFAKSGVSREESLKGAYLNASQHFRNAHSSRRALEMYAKYCRLAFSAPVRFYRLLRYSAGLLIKG